MFMAEGERSSRPSFASFWRRGKDRLKGRDVKFADPDGRGSGSGTAKAEEERTKKEKAQVRRAQVRKAQIQHRERKANYVKSLELDVTQYRDMIKQAQVDALSLRKDNEIIRAHLRLAGVDPPEAALTTLLENSSAEAVPDAMVLDDLVGSPPVQLQPQGTAQEPSWQEGREMFGSVNVDDLTITLSTDEVIGTPVFTISSNPSSEHVGQCSQSPSWSHGHKEMTQEQENSAINFILALEHVCWDHFWAGDFWNHNHTTEEDKNHTLLASTYAMASAPESVYTDREALKKKHKDKTLLGPTAPLEWQGSSAGINLDSLHGLAQSLNPSDKEVTPVQAWFELVKRYGVERLMDGQTLEALKGQFHGVVKCVGFGAAMERLAFESVVTRVLGPPSVPWTIVNFE